jgi:hypothetical protein
MPALRSRISFLKRLALARRVATHAYFDAILSVAISDPPDPGARIAFAYMIFACVPNSIYSASNDRQNNNNLFCTHLSSFHHMSALI